MTAMETPEISRSISPDRRFAYMCSEGQVEPVDRIARQIHVACYQRMGFVKPEGIINGRFAPGIDKANGSNVDYAIGFPTGTQPDDDSGRRGSLRKIHIKPDGDVYDLPSFGLCEPSLTKEGLQRIHGVDDRGSKLKEIAALSGEDGLSIFYMLKHAIHIGLPNRETWFFAIVSDTFDSLIANFGSKTITQIGAPTKIPDSRVSDHIKLVPALVDTTSFIDNMRLSFIDSRDPREKSRIARSLLMCVDGMDEALLSPETISFAKALQVQGNNRNNERTSRLS